jgi:hypothetical protein
VTVGTLCADAQRKAWFALSWIADTTKTVCATKQERIVKKGRHRRFEEARAMKRVSLLPVSEPCDECGAAADEKCASWCLARVLDEEDDIENEFDDELDDELDDESGEADDVSASQEASAH